MAVIEIRNETVDPQGAKEAMAVDLEKYGDVRVVSVREVPPEQMRM